MKGRDYLKFVAKETKKNLRLSAKQTPLSLSPFDIDAVETNGWAVTLGKLPSITGSSLEL